MNIQHSPKRNFTSVITAMICTGFISFTAFQLHGLTLPSSDVSLAVLSYAKGDIKRKGSDEANWLVATERSQIGAGEEVWSGKNSSAQVVVKDGRKIDLGSDSKIEFLKAQAPLAPVLENGNFRLYVDSKSEFMIEHEKVEIEGRNAEVQVFVESQNAKFDLLSGTAKLVPQDGNIVNLRVGQVEGLHDAATRRLKEKQFAAHAAALPLPPVSLRLPASVQPPTYTYRFKITDLYEKNGKLVHDKAKLPERVKTPVQVTWQPSGPVQRVFIQHAPSRESLDRAPTFEATLTSYEFKEVYIGENYWRASIDRVSWTEPRSFVVTAIVKEKSAPRLVTLKSQFVLDGPLSKYDLPIQKHENNESYLVEASGTPVFAKNRVSTKWYPDNKIALTLREPGTYFFRVRGVGTNRELTDWSKAFRLDVKKPSLKSAPKVARAHKI